MKNHLKKISELTKGDLFEIGAEVVASQRILAKKIKDFLGIPVEESVGIAVELSPYERFIQTAVFEDFLKTQKFTILHKVQLEGDYYITPFEYSSIEIGIGETKQAIKEGYVFIESTAKKLRFIISFSDLGYKCYKIQVITKPKNSEVARTLLSDLSVYAKEHNILKNKKITPALTHLKPSPQYTWDSVILPDKVKKEIRQNVDLLISNIEVYKKNNMTFKRGLILKGVPGTGKTLIGKVLCNTINAATFIWVTPGDLTEVRKVRSICEIARGLAPTILFLEDIDLYGGHRERENRGILGELMNQLDGLVENEFVVVIATTNRSEELEVALRNRPGRFDRLIEVPLPDETCRMQMLNLFLSSNSSLEIENRKKLIGELVGRTKDFTGAHVKELVNSAIIEALDSKSLNKKGHIILKRKHFLENIKAVKEKKISVGFSALSDENRHPTPLDDDY